MFNWEEFIKLSQELISNFNTQHNEALYRTVISRAYYGIFKQVEDSLKKRVPQIDIKGRKLGSHDKYIEFLRNHTLKEVAKFGSLLANLKLYRLKADYDAYSSIDRRSAKRILQESLKLNAQWNRIKSKV